MNTLKALLAIDPDAMSGWSVRDLQDAAHALLDENAHLKARIDAALVHLEDSMLQPSARVLKAVKALRGEGGK